MSQPRESSNGGWFGWMFTSERGDRPGHIESTRIGYDRMEDSISLDNHGPSSRRSGSELTQRSSAAENVYGYGYSAYQMSDEHYDLQLKRKDKKPSINSLWARIKYWLQYTWKMFKVGLIASGPGMTSGPMMAPPPMANIISRTTRHRFAKEGPMPDVVM